MFVVLASALLLLSPTFAAPAPKPTPEQRAQEKADRAVQQEIDAARRAAEQHDNSVDSWIRVLRTRVTADPGLVARGALTWEEDGAPAVAAIVAELAARPSTAQMDYLEAARIAQGFGRAEDAAALAEKVIEVGPVGEAISMVFVTVGDPAKVLEKCKEYRKRVKGDWERFQVLDACFKQSGAPDVKTGLAWASSDDRAYYSKEAAVDWKQLAANYAETHPAKPVAPAATSSPATTGASSGAASAASTSVSAHVSCAQNVRLFRGSSTGSGTYGWVSPNTTTSYTLHAGEQMCVCDGSDKRLSCWTPSGQASLRVEIGCGGISAR